MMEADAYAKEHGLQGFTCNQLMWSLPDINFDNLDDKTFILMDAPTFAYHNKEQKSSKYKKSCRKIQREEIN